MLLILRLIVLWVSKVAVNLCVVLLVTLASGNIQAQGAEVEIKAVTGKVDTDLRASMASFFEQADIINVLYVPYANLGSRLLDKEDLLNAWRYNFSFRCAGSCKEAGGEVKQFFWNSYLLEEECPKPYTVAINLKKREVPVKSIFINYAGNCFTVDGVSYFVKEEKIYELLKKKELYPSFVK